MTVNRRAEGALAEKAALDFLINKGMRHVASNYHAPGGEIDLILLDGDELVFAEVRSTSKDSPLVSPEDTVRHVKQGRLKAAANHFIESGAAEDLNFGDARFDFLAVRTGLGKPQITHYPDAFR